MSFKICIVGCGWMAEKGHGPSYLKYKGLNPGVILAGCCDLDAERAKAFAANLGFDRYYTDYAMMLDKENPDAVCLISSVKATKSLSVDIIKKGYPLILEKPPGVNAEETTEIINAAREYKVPARVAFNRRYMPLLRHLKNELADRGQPIRNITYTFIRKGRRDLDFSTTAIHGIDTSKYLVGSDYKEVHFEYQSIPGCEDYVSNIYMYCKFESGATGQLIFEPMGGGVMERAAISLPNCTYFLELPVWGAVDSPGRIIKMEGNEIAKVITGNDVSDGSEMFETNGFYAENALFFDELRSGNKPESDVESGLQSVAIADCIRNRMSSYHKT